jgi:GNAT superfamily N-acetyltransferase
VPEKVDERHKKLSDYIMKKNGYTLVTYKDRKSIKNDAKEVFKVIDRAFSVLYGTVPLTDAVVDKALKDYIPILNLKYACSIRDKDGAIIGFGLMLPSIVKAAKKSNGRLFPFGILRMLKALNGKNDTLEMYFVAVKPELQKQGLPAILLNHLTQVCIDNGVRICETGPELETNESVQSMWKGQDARQHRRRRCFKKAI